MAAAIEPPDVVNCTHCGRPTLKVDEWDECERCAAKTAGYAEGEAAGSEMMFHLAVAGARMAMSDGEVRRVFEHVMGGGQLPFHVDGV